MHHDGVVAPAVGLVVAADECALTAKEYALDGLRSSNTSVGSVFVREPKAYGLDSADVTDTSYRSAPLTGIHARLIATELRCEQCSACGTLGGRTAGCCAAANDWAARLSGIFIKKTRASTRADGVAAIRAADS